MAGVSSPKFEWRYFALVDLIGFSEKVRARSEIASPEKLELIYTALNLVVQESDLGKRGINVEITMFSDTIIVSTPRPTESIQEVEFVLASFLWCIRRIAVLLLQHGFLSRGCIIEDEIFHRQGLVVGPAIIAAHTFESRIANFPRIIIVRKLRDVINGLSRFQKWVRQSDDGPMFLHVLYEFEKFARQVPDVGHRAAEGEEPFKFICRARETISRYLSETRDDPRHFEKNRWFARYMETEVIQLYKGSSWSAWPKAFDIKQYY
jgi:hypothetical protein